MKVLAGLGALALPLASVLAPSKAAPSVGIVSTSLRAELLAREEANRWASARLLPSGDATLIAYTVPMADGERSREGDRFALGVYDLKSRQRHVVDSAIAHPRILAWSHSGKRLAFACQRESLDALCIWDAASREIMVIRSASPAPIMDAYSVVPQWSVDDSEIYLVVTLAGPAAGASRAPARGANVRVRTTMPTPASPTRTPTAAASLSMVAVVRLSAVDGAVLDTLPVPAYVHQVSAFSLSPNGKRLALVDSMLQGFPPAIVEDPKGATPLTILDVGDKRMVAARLNGAPSMVGVPPNSQYISWSPDSTRIAIGTGAWDLTGKKPADDRVRTYVITLRGSEYGISNIGCGRTFDAKAPPLWSEDGASILVTAQGVVSRVGVDQPCSVKTLPGAGDKIVAVISSGTPAHIESSEAGFSLMATGQRRFAGKDEVLAVSVDEADRSVSFRSLDGRLVSRISMSSSASPDADLTTAAPPDMLLAWDTPQSPFEVLSINLAASSARRIGLADPVVGSVPRRRLVTWTDAFGNRASGILFLPDQRGDEKPPLVIGVYPGASDYAFNEHGWWGADVTLMPEVFARHGVAFLMAGVAASGKDRCEQIRTSVEGAREAGVASGLVDAARVGVIGHSYGGYGALCAALGDTFQAVISVNGPTDLAVNALGVDGGEIWATGQGGLPGSFVGAQADYFQNSPLIQYRKLRSPILLIAGEKDRTVPAIQSAMLYNAIRQAGGPATLIMYPDEGHHIGAWSVENRIDYACRTLTWVVGVFNVKSSAESCG